MLTTQNEQINFDSITNSNYYESIKNKILFIKETIIKRCLSLKSIIVHL